MAWDRTNGMPLPSLAVGCALSITSFAFDCPLRKKGAEVKKTSPGAGPSKA